MKTTRFVAKAITRFRHLKDDESGNVAVIFTLALLPLVGFVGASVDYTHGNAVKASMQAAVDAVSLNLAKSASSLNETQLNQKATDSFNALFQRSETQGVTVSAQYSAGAKSVTVTAAGSINTDFMGVMGRSTLNIGARAVAVVKGEGTACVLALNKNASGAALAQGSTTVNLTGCSLYDNSNNASALTVGGSAKLTALSVGVVGGISGNAGITTTAGIQTGVSPIEDPYSKLEIPAFSGCLVNNFTSKKKETINPGVYCGGMKLNAGADVTLNAGVYTIDRGDLTVNGGATMTGTGVTIIFTSSTGNGYANASINGGATVNLTPPTTGSLAGVVMFGDRNAPVGTKFDFNGGATQYIGGALYFPTGAVTFAGGAGTSASCTKLIADTIKFTGNSDFAIDCKAMGVKAFGPSGVRLAS
jgi:Flp pilus assembly protein TadG